MRITVVNGGSGVVPLPGYTSVGPGESKVLTGRSIDEFLALASQFAGSSVRVFAQLEASDLPPVKAQMKDPGDGTGGASSVSGVGFDLVDPRTGAAVPTQAKFYVGVFDDQDGTAPAANATLGSASNGTILEGDGTNTILVNTDANGVFACTLTDNEDETVYVRVWPHPETGMVVDTSGVDSVTFSA